MAEAAVPSVRRKMSFQSGLLASGALDGDTFPSGSNFPDFPIHILLSFKDPPQRAKLIESVKTDVLAKQYRYRCRAVKDKKDGLVYEEMEGELNWDYLVKEEEHPDEDSISARLDKILLTTLDPSQPLWDMTVLINKTGESKLVVRVCHCIGDGLGLIQSWLPMFRNETGGPATPPAILAARTTRGKPPPTPPLLTRIMNVFEMITIFIYAFFKCVTLTALPGDKHTSFAPKESLNPFKYSGRRSLTKADLSNLQTIKDASKVLGVTINDLMTAVLTQAIHRYLESKDEAKQLKQLRALIPVSLPRDGDPVVNKWSFVSLTLPMTSSFASCLKTLTQSLTFLKKSPEPYITLRLNALLNAVVPKFAMQGVAKDLMSKHTLVFTNMPGPPEYVFLSGQRVESIYVYLANVNTQVSLISYAGQVTMTLVADERHVDRPEAIMQSFDEVLGKVTATSTANPASSPSTVI